jgi:hypothetical protein
LFKYLAPDRLDALDGWLRCSPAIVLNDVFEMTTNFTAWAPESEYAAMLRGGWSENFDKAMKEKLHEAGVTYEQLLAIPQARELLEQFRQWDPSPVIRPVMDGLIPTLNEIASAKFGSLIGVVSFTEEPASLLMWAHYADKHMGFVVEYAPEHPWFDRRRGPDDEFFRLRQVHYQTERAAVVATQTSGEELMLTKSEEWSYEKEWRVVLPLEGCVVKAQDAHHGVPVHAVQVPREAIRRVILGCRMSPEARRVVIERAAGLPIHEAVPSKKTYGLETRAVPSSAASR